MKKILFAFGLAVSLAIAPLATASAAAPAVHPAVGHAQSADLAQQTPGGITDINPNENNEEGDWGLWGLLGLPGLLGLLGLRKGRETHGSSPTNRGTPPR